MDENRRNPAETGGAKKDGRPKANLLEIKWKPRAEALWKIYPELKKSVGELLEAARHADRKEIGEYEDFRRKFAGKIKANPAYASALFKATEFDRVGVTLDDWIADDDQWNASITGLSPVDPVGILKAHAEKSSMTLVLSSTPSQEPRTFRRLEVGGKAETKLRIGEYMQLAIGFDTGDPAPVYLMALEWSERSRDWQVFSMIEGSLFDHARPVPVTVRGDTASVGLTLGLPIAGPSDQFELFVLAKRTEFDHRARARLEKLRDRQVLTPLEMGRVLHELFAGNVSPEVALARFLVA